jgi:hypothetical protein
MSTLAEQWERVGQIRVLLHQIERKFGPPSEAIRQRIEEADAETLLEWAPRIFDANSAEEMLK